jgi:hypothetical protein
MRGQRSFDEVREALRTRWGEPPGGPFWDEIEDAVRWGWEMAQRPEYQGQTFEDAEADLREHWYLPESPSEETAWDQVRDAVRLAWAYARGQA